MILYWLNLWNLTILIMCLTISINCSSEYPCLEPKGEDPCKSPFHRLEEEWEEALEEKPREELWRE